ncbi:MAG TPA: Ldh family oxidoreductase [Candidatus Choladousia intestinavium]|uniref:Ldh family oxidoreductase n=1 Tax=Candidatus Choladousia intestinavium TaxID=2840727 RepID=A0A9D1ADA9_9FIRM|nr:Ldh family oxidoreductase [Candidatus Choladousia intestinavium]
MSYKKYRCDKVRELAHKVFAWYGFSEDEAEKITDVLLTSDLYGIESHGVQRMTLYPYGIDIGRIKVGAELEIVKETPVSVLLDAHDSMGQLAGIRGMELAIEKAKKTGIGIAEVKNSNHFGIAGYYSMMAAKKGLLGISMTNTEALVVPTFGRKPIMGTNPIAVTMPASPHCFHLDMSTSVVTAGKMEVYAKNQKPLLSGWSVGKDGRENLDAAEFLNIRATKSNGGLLPLGGYGEEHGGHKGYGISLVVELMTGILSGGFTSTMVRKDKKVEKCCHTLIAMDYGMFGDKKEIEERFSAYLQEIRDSEKAEGHDRIYIHGDKEMEHMAEVLKENSVAMNEATYNEISKLCEKCGISAEEYLIEL